MGEGVECGWVRTAAPSNVPMWYRGARDGKGGGRRKEGQSWVREKDVGGGVQQRIQRCLYNVKEEDQGWVSR